VHPSLQVGVMRGILLAACLTARQSAFRWSRDAAAHPVVNRVDTGRGRDHLLRIAEGERQHRANCRMQPAPAGKQAAAKGAVVVYAGGDRGMRQLEQDGTAPAGDHDHLAIDSPGDAIGPGAHVLRSEQAGPDRRAVAFGGLGYRRHSAPSILSRVSAPAESRSRAAMASLDYRRSTRASLHRSVSSG
jgi:hypothetical protein